eukprot:TRINITY_DN6069_c0_g2_i2.p3 TRINITY_DN6069_c0_g2~~TRINITY_DN6069_c0_g2_i2.p3  ORF type:complete len:213 (+),score=-23.38 TRINITY_DN6069_c0_g2_i2:418-1056(+)
MHLYIYVRKKVCMYWWMDENVYDSHIHAHFTQIKCILSQLYIYSSNLITIRINLLQIVYICDKNMRTQFVFLQQNHKGRHKQVKKGQNSYRVIQLCLYTCTNIYKYVCLGQPKTMQNTQSIYPIQQNKTKQNILQNIYFYLKKTTLSVNKHTKVYYVTEVNKEKICLRIQKSSVNIKKQCKYKKQACTCRQASVTSPNRLSVLQKLCCCLRK